MGRIVDENSVEEIISSLSAIVLAKVVRLNRSQIVWLCRSKEDVSLILFFKLETFDTKSSLVFSATAVSDRDKWDYVFDYKSFSIEDVEISKVRKWLTNFFKNEVRGELDFWREKDFQLIERTIKDLFNKGIINLYMVEDLRRQI